MPVSIKKMNVEMEVKNKGIEFEVRDANNHLGDLVVNKAGVVWCKGRTRRANGVKLTWAELIELIEEA